MNFFNKHQVLIINFGGQYNRLILRSLNNLNVSCVIKNYFDINKEYILKKNYKAIILTGGPDSLVKDNNKYNLKKLKFLIYLKIPVLGICFGHQLLAKLLNLNLKRSKIGEFGEVELLTLNNKNLFKNIKLSKNIVWMSHNDTIDSENKSIIVTSKSKNCNIASFKVKDKLIFGVQFHPEVFHTNIGKEIFKNFLFNISNCKKDFSFKKLLTYTEKLLQTKIKNKKAVCAISGGVDSLITAVLSTKSLKRDNLICIFINNGLLRYNEVEKVEEIFKTYNLNYKIFDFSDLFLKKLKNIIEPEEKRKIIGNLFYSCFNYVINHLSEKVDYLIQGTLYSDLIESGNHLSSTIKTHHNLIKIDKKYNLEIIEPIKHLFKDQVRELGKLLNIKSCHLNRQPFPGPALAIRIIGSVTKEKVILLQKITYIFNDEIKKHNLSDKLWQYFAVLTNTKSVGVKGDSRVYNYVVALKAIESIDGMTAKPYKINFDILFKISNRLQNEIKEVNRVVYDISSKPPATIEWE